MSPDVIAAGVFGVVGAVVGAVLGALVGLLGERWVRSRGEVECKTDWRPAQGEGSVNSPGGHRVLERHLTVTFENHKDIPVTVWEMRMVFYKGDKLLEEAERPVVSVIDERAEYSPISWVSLPPHIPVTRTISVAPNRVDHAHYDYERLRVEEKLRGVQEADRIEFVAVLDGNKVIREDLALWGQLPEE